MKKPAPLISVFILLLFSTALPTVITQPLQEKISEMPSDELISVNLVMKEQADLRTMISLTKGRRLEERRKIIVNYLKQIQTTSQKEILTFLSKMEKRERVEKIRLLWICNTISFKATKEVIDEVATFSGIRSIDLNEKRVLIKPQQSIPTVPTGREIVWNVSLVEAPTVWGLGYTGDGIIVGLIDTGVRYTHNDLADHIWTNPGEIPNNGIDDDGNGYVDDYYGYDFVNGDSDPMDDYGHGTHCAGSVASDGTAGSQCGVAPDARIMSLKVLDSGGSGTEAGVWEAIQYSIDNGAHIMSLSLGWSHAWSPDRPTWRTTCNNALAAGVNMSIAAGNEDNSYGPPDNVRTPGDCPPPWLHPDQTLIGGLSAVVTVGATDINDDIASFSSRGPVSWEGISPFDDYPYNPEMGLIDPDVSAPGVDIKSLDYSSDNGYVSGWNGTSMATPHVAGAMALMLDKNPTITTALIDSILEVTAVELGAPGKDNDYGSGRIDCYQAVLATPGMGSPNIPSLISPFNFVRLPDTQPELSFTSTDPQADSIQYRVLWDTDPNFGSPDSATTSEYESGALASLTIPSPLMDGVTVWWKVKCTDPDGSGLWTQFSEKRSLTVGTILPPNTWTWYQTTNAQFQYCTLNGTVIEGDSIILGNNVPDTVLVQGFESATFPPTGWARFAGPGNSSTENWNRLTDESHSGSASAGVKYDGSNTVDRFLATSSLDLTNLTNCEVVFWHRDNWASYYSYHGVWASTTTQTNPSDYSEVVETGPTSEDTWEKYTADISTYNGVASLYLAWRYNELDGTDWWVDDIEVIGYTQGTAGTVTGTAVTYGDFPVRLGWDRAYWTKSTASDSIMLQIEYQSGGSWALIPDGDLPGNSTGFLTSLQTGEVDISGLDTTIYDTLRLTATLMSSTVDPALLNWEVGVFTDIETDPPEPFSLLSPPDSTLTTNNRPSFFWETTVDTGSGLKDYNVYIEGILRHTGIDTTWTADYDLAEGYNDWYVVARDSVNNARQSNETWTVIIDTEAPSVVSLISPPDNGYLNNSSVTFTWHASEDSVSGVDHYVLQYALDSGFSVGVVEITTVDTSFTTNLPDTSYYWHVKAVDGAANESAYSSAWQFEVDTDAPAAPTLTSPVGGVWLTNTSVDFQWSAVTIESDEEKPELSSRQKIDKQIGFNSGNEGFGNPFLDDAGSSSGTPLSPVRYVIQVDTTTGFASPVFIDTLASTSTTTTLSEDIYYWRVRAYDLAGNEGPFSTDENFGVDATPPSTVSLLSPSDNGYVNTSTVNFVWNEADDNLSGVDYYVLQYALDSGFSVGVVEITTVDTSFTTNLPDTSYYWHVKAVDVATNESAYSSTWQFEVDTDTPAAPTLTSPVGGVWLTNTSVDFQWSTVTFSGDSKFKRSRGAIPLSPVRYVFQVDTNSSFTSPIIVDTLTTNSTNETLSEDIYYWRVRAFDLAGNEGPFSTDENFGVDITSPVIESTTVWTDTSYIGPFEISTRVTDNLSGLDSVLLYYMRDEDPDWVMEIMHQSGDWFTDSIPTVANSNDTVRYYIRAIDVATNESTDPDGAPGAYYSFVANLTGVAESADLPQQFNFRVSSVVKGHAIFKFAIPKSGSMNLRIYDITGRLVAKPLSGNFDSGRFQILFKPARSGIYFYKLKSQFENRTGKIVIF